jgi:hypothetical protein
MMDFSISDLINDQDHPIPTVISNRLCIFRVPQFYLLLPIGIANTENPPEVIAIAGSPKSRIHFQ